MKRQQGYCRVVELTRVTLIVSTLLGGIFSGPGFAYADCNFQYRSPDLDYYPSLFPASGAAPLIVEATWNKNWSSAYDEVPERWKPALYETFLYLDWGDGTDKTPIPAQRCPDPSVTPGYGTKNWPPQTLTHVYSQPGTYTVQLGMSAGGGQISWRKMGKVSVDSQVNVDLQCDFSTGPTTERCFGGVGSQCEGNGGLRFVKDENTCLVSGWISVGSILHDECCIETDNKGNFCANPTTSRCTKEFLEAMSNVACHRYWSKVFGPYFAHNTGDDMSKSVRLPVGARVKLNQQDFCPTGKCLVDKKGKPIMHPDPYGCGDYCECQ